MKEFIKHIETLLLEHECVIVPGFGGFVTYYAPARCVEKEYLFLPPYRTVGFNPSLQLNDGLLIQAYMQAHEASYPAAQRLLEEAIDEVRDTLTRNGHIELGKLGVLTAHIDGSLEFRPTQQGLQSPMLYGLRTFMLKPLSELPQPSVKPTLVVSEEKPKSHNTLTIHINRTWLNNAVAIAAAVILFFILSTPVKNTYVEPESYASLGGSAGWLGPLHTPAKETASVQPNLSLEATPSSTPEKPIEKDIKMPQEMPETVASAPRPQPAPVQTKKIKTAAYHIIVSSVVRQADAEELVAQLKKKGYAEASVITGDGRARVALKTSADKEALNQEMIQLRQKNEAFKNAWLLTTHTR